MPKADGELRPQIAAYMDRYFFKQADIVGASSHTHVYVGSGHAQDPGGNTSGGTRAGVGEEIAADDQDVPNPGLLAARAIEAGLARSQGHGGLLLCFGNHS